MAFNPVRSQAEKKASPSSAASISVSASSSARGSDSLRPGRLERTRHKLPRADIKCRGGIVLEYSLGLRELAQTQDERFANTPTGAGQRPSAPEESPDLPLPDGTPPVDEEAQHLARRLDAVDRGPGSAAQRLRE